MALVLGPEIVEHPAFIAGTVAVIEIPAAGLRGELLWPSIRPTARPKRRHLAVAKPAKPVAGQATAAAATAKLTVGAPAHDDPTLRAQIEASLPKVGRLEAEGDAIAAAILAAALAAPLAATESIEPLPPVHRGAAPASPLAINSSPGATRIVAGVEMPADFAAGRSTQATTTSVGTTLPPRFAGSGGHRWVMWGLGAAAVLLAVGTGYASRGTQSSVVDRSPVTTSAGMPTRVAVDTAVAARVPGDSGEVPRGDLRRVDKPDRDPAETINDAVSSPKSATTGSEERQATPAKSAAQVTLRMRGGGFEVAGELKGFDGSKYVIATAAQGLMTMDASRFECIGEACARPAATILSAADRPSPRKPDAFAIEGTSALGADYIPRLVKAYAASIGASVDVSSGPVAGAMRLRILDARGAELAAIDVVASSTTAAFAALERGTAQIAMTDRSHDEVAPPRSRAPTPAEQFVGQDVVAVIASPESPLVSLPIETLAKVLAGQITDWFDLGHARGPDRAYRRGRGRRNRGHDCAHAVAAARPRIGSGCNAAVVGCRGRRARVAVAAGHRNHLAGAGRRRKDGQSGDTMWSRRTSHDLRGEERGVSAGAQALSLHERAIDAADGARPDPVGRFRRRTRPGCGKSPRRSVVRDNRSRSAGGANGACDQCACGVVRHGRDAPDAGGSRWRQAHV